jgi:D-glycero-alpha-D-manno-heptose-7-phosphate kinase
MTSPFLDECYEVARKKGALGGKLIGAGGSGFFMFYCNNIDSQKPRLVEAMQKMGLRWERFQFEFEGAKILVNA